MHAVILLILAALGMLVGVAMWRRLRAAGVSVPLRAAAMVALAWAVSVGGSKAPPSVGDRIGNFVYWTVTGSMVDPTGVVAEYAETAAVEAFESDTAGIVAAVTGAVAGVSADADALHAYATGRDLQIVYLAADAPRDLPGVVANHNIAIANERAAVVDGVYSVWFRYSWELSDAAGISATFTVGGDVVTIASHTNTFPNIEYVGTIPCYRYDFDISALCGTNCPVVIAPYEAEFGGPAGSGIPLSTPADLEIVTDGGAVTNAGLTGWVAVPHMEPLALRVEGGVVVEAAAHGTNYTGVAGGEVYL